jgi:hypothetical protein
VIADVGELVGEDALELRQGQLPEQAGGHHDGGVVGVAAGGEAVGRLVVDHIQVGFGQPGRDAEALHEVVVARLVVERNGPGMT